MTGPSTDIGRDLVVFVDPQTTSFTAPESDIPLAANALRVITASVNGKSPFALFEDKRGSSTPFGVIDQKRSAEWSLECYAYTTTSGTAPDWADLLTSGGWQAETSGDTTIRGTASTTTQVNVNSTSGMGAGSCIIVGGEIRRITAVDATPGAANVTVTPALSTAPTTASEAVTGGIVYRPKDAKDTTPDSNTIWAFNNNSADRLIGGVVGTNSFTMGGDEAARITFSGTGRQDNRMAQTALDGGINDSVTTIAVDSGVVVPSDASASNPYYYQVNSEVIKVIGVSANNLTVDTRGGYGTPSTSAASHSDGDLVFPHQPTGDYAGTPIPATSGELLVEGAEFQAGSISVEVDQGIIYRENVHGDAYVVDGYVGGRRAVTATLDGWSFYDSTLIQALNARDRTSVSVFAQQGDTAGGIVAIELPTFYFEEPDMDRGGDEVTVSMTGQAVGTAAETEIYLMVG